jgi:hypothetical protein
VAHIDDSTASERLIFRLGLILAGSVVLVQTVLYLLHVHAFDRGVAVLDLEEGGLVTWATSSATFAVGVVALLLTFLDPEVGWRGPAIAIGTAFISFDDTVVLHERIGFEITGALGISDSYMRIVWPTLYAPLLVAVAVLVFQLARANPTAHRLVVMGLVGLGAAIVLEVVGVALDRAGLDQESWQWTLKAILEEGAELAAWILIACGVSVRLIAFAGDGRDRTPV